MNITKIDLGAALDLIGIVIAKEGPFQAASDLKLLVRLLQSPKFDILALAKSGELLPLVEVGLRLFPVLAVILNDRDQTARLIDLLQSLQSD